MDSGWIIAACVLLAPLAGAAAVMLARVWDEPAADGAAPPASSWRDAIAFYRWSRDIAEGAPAWRRPAGELGAIAVAAAALWATGEAGPAFLAASLLLGWLLLVHTLIDAHVWRLPDPINLLLFAAGLSFTAWFMPERLTAHVIGAAAGYGALRLVAALYHRARGRAGLGLGDAKLLGAVGAWLGWSALPFVVSVGAGAALIVIITVGVLRRWRGSASGVRGGDALPFGPFLAFGAWVMWLASVRVGFL